MKTNYKEYTRLRDIAQKRIGRISEAGLAPRIHIPTVKELKAQGVSAAEATRRLTEFVSAGTTKREFSKATAMERSAVIASTQKAIKAEKRKAQERAASRAYRERLRNLTKEQKAELKGAKKLGIKIPPRYAEAYSEYMKIRYEMDKDTFKYTKLYATEEFASMIQKKGYDPNQIAKDFQQYLNDRNQLEQSASQMKGYSQKDSESIVFDFIKDKVGGGAGSIMGLIEKLW